MVLSITSFFLFSSLSEYCISSSFLTRLYDMYASTRDM